MKVPRSYRHYTRGIHSTLHLPLHRSPDRMDLEWMCAGNSHGYRSRHRLNWNHWDCHRRNLHWHRWNHRMTHEKSFIRHRSHRRRRQKMKKQTFWWTVAKPSPTVRTSGDPIVGEQGIKCNLCSNKNMIKMFTVCKYQKGNS